MTQSDGYAVPDGSLSLSGPVTLPAPGTLPLRGDMAHIALAEQFLVPHYAVPQIVHLGDDGADLKAAADAESETLATLNGGAQFEVLDVGQDWVWGCLGPEGPSGYIPADAINPASQGA